MQHFEFTISNQSLDIFVIVVELLTALVGGGQKALLQTMKATLVAFKKSDQARRKLFSRNSSSWPHGNFQINSCTVDKSGQVSVKLLGAYFNASKVDSGYLFLTYSKSDIKLMKYFDSLTLNEQAYSQVCQEIIKNLENETKTFVAGLDFY